MDAPITVDWRESAAHDACGSAVGRLSPLATVLARNFHDYGRGANWLDQATGGARHTRTSFSGPRAPGVGGARKGRAQHALHPARQRRRPEHRGARWTQKTLVTGFTGCWRRWTSVRACVGHCVCSRARQVRPSPYCVKVRALAAGRACPRTDAAISALGSSEVTLPPSRRVGWLLEASRGRMPEKAASQIQADHVHVDAGEADLAEQAVGSAYRARLGDVLGGCGVPALGWEAPWALEAPMERAKRADADQAGSADSSVSWLDEAYRRWSRLGALTSAGSRWRR
ncbi:hypothetical protein FHU30_004598 [Actinomadura rupiterrae]|nr:hypothetical protein [Actinomadura rupiterrae]